MTKQLITINRFTTLARIAKVLNDLQRARIVNKWAKVGRKVNIYA